MFGPIQSYTHVFLFFFLRLWKVDPSIMSDLYIYTNLKSRLRFSQSCLSTVDKPCTNFFYENKPLKKDISSHEGDSLL